VSAADFGDSTGSATSPVPINGLGLAYMVQNVVDGVAPGSSAAAAGLQPGDTIAAVNFITKDHEGKTNTGLEQDVKPLYWAFVDHVVQYAAPHELDVIATRGGHSINAKLTAKPDDTFPVADRGLEHMPEVRVQRAESVGQALEMGLHITVRKIRSMYISLYAMAFGRVSAIQTMSGPITLGRLAYIIAGESTYKLLLLLSLISINLAVVNFLPIPMLDGGHMMFLLYEGIVGKPPPEKVHWWLSIAGLVCVLALMLFVVGLDLWRLAKMWMGW
jgi:regulator of sigma E protease